MATQDAISHLAGVVAGGKPRPVTRIGKVLSIDTSGDVLMVTLATDGEAASRIGRWMVSGSPSIGDTVSYIDESPLVSIIGAVKPSDAPPLGDAVVGTWTAEVAQPSTPCGSALSTYATSGRLVVAAATIRVSSAGGANQVVRVKLPFPPIASGIPCGQLRIQDTSVPKSYLGMAFTDLVDLGGGVHEGWCYAVSTDNGDALGQAASSFNAALDSGGSGDVVDVVVSYVAE